MRGAFLFISFIMNSSQVIRPFGDSGVHSYHRRSFHHDYRNPFIYHIILKKRKGFEDFGSIIEGSHMAIPGVRLSRSRRRAG